MFNGLEYDYDEDIELYINRAIKKALTEYKETVILKKNDDTTDDSSSDDDDDDDETNSNYNIDEEGPIIIKRIILTTKNSGGIEEHENIIDRFNFKYGTLEKGSNGSNPIYWTNGETQYIINDNKNLFNLYNTNIKDISINGCKVNIQYLNLEKTEYNNNLLNNFLSCRNENKCITLPSDFNYGEFINKPYIKNRLYYNNAETIHNKDFECGDVLYYNDNKYNNYICFYTVISITNYKLQIRPLKPIIQVIQRKRNGQVNKIFKYVNNKIDYTVKSRYVNKSNFDTKYILDDYIYKTYWK